MLKKFVFEVACQSEFWTLVKGGIGLIAMRLWEASSKLAAMPTSPQAPHLSPRCQDVSLLSENQKKQTFTQKDMVQTFPTKTPKWSF